MWKKEEQSRREMWFVGWVATRHVPPIDAGQGRFCSSVVAWKIKIEEQSAKTFTTNEIPRRRKPMKAYLTQNIETVD